MTEKKKTAEGKNKKVESAENKPRAIASGINVWCRSDDLCDITTLVPNDKNPNKHPDKQIALLAKIIRHQGWRQPITISTRSGFIVKGHGRFQAAKVLNVELVPVEYQDYETEAAEYADLLADNRLAELAEPDADMIDDLLKDAMFEDFDLELTGFSTADLLPETTNGLTDGDDVPDVPEEPVAKLGHIWKLGDHRLMCGDSTDRETVGRLMDGAKADMVLTDPPYGMSLDADFSKMSGNGRKGKTYDKVLGDNEDFKDTLITSIFDNFDCDEVFLWGVDYYFDLIPKFKEGSLIVWDKTLQTNGDAGYNSEFELLWSKTPHKKEIIHFNWFRYFGLSSQDIKTREHPTQKPLQVITPFIEKHCKENGVVVDVYGGSGSTLITCEQLNRTCYMMEIDPKYCDVIIKRWESLTGQKAELLDG